MAKLNAIKENHLFSKVYAKGKSHAGRYFIVYALRNFRSSQTRLGITTKKKLGGAVKRSRVRRLAREAFRLICNENVFRAPFLIVVVARSAAFEEGIKMPQVKEDIKRSMEHLKLFVREEEK